MSRPYHVYAIEAGTVIDHIPFKKSLEVIRLLGLDASDDLVTVGMGFTSKKLGKKDLVKIEHRELTSDELNKISLVAPHATINIIRNHERAEKKSIAIPSRVEGMISCTNLNCITNHERYLKTVFVHDATALRFSCHYCEKRYQMFELSL